MTAKTRVVMGKIITHRDRFSDQPLEETVASFVKAIHGSEVEARVRNALKRGAIAPAIVHAEVNHGRWIVKCHTCRGAQLANRWERWFFCTDCLNQRFDGRLVSVHWPDEDEVRKIEGLLMERDDPGTRHWKPSETVDDLARENADHGVMS